MNKKVIAVCFVSLFTLVISAQFTEKRAKRGPSMNALKESCVTACADILEASADVLGSLSQVQKKSLSIVSEYATGDKNGWCATSSREKLAMHQKKLTHLHEKLEAIKDECDALIHSLG